MLIKDQKKDRIVNANIIYRNLNKIIVECENQTIVVGEYEDDVRAKQVFYNISCFFENSIQIKLENSNSKMTQQLFYMPIE